MKFRQKIAPILVGIAVMMSTSVALNFTINHSASASNEADTSEDRGSGSGGTDPSERLDQIGAPETSVIPSGWGIAEILNLILNVLTAGVGIAATISIAVAGFMYSTAGSNSTQVSKAKTMILNTVVGIIAYLLVWALLQWLVPGGVLN